MKTAITLSFLSLSKLILADMPKEIRTEIIINASPAEVWKILADLPEWGSWNPFINCRKGKAKEGVRLVNDLKQGEKTYTFKPILTKVSEAKELAWKGRLLVPGLFDGHHRFLLEDLGNGKTRLVHIEHFKGILSGFLLKRIGEDTRRSFEEMNQALKQVAEQGTD